MRQFRLGEKMRKKLEPIYSYEMTLFQCKMHQNNVLILKNYYFFKKIGLNLSIH